MTVIGNKVDPLPSSSKSGFNPPPRPRPTSAEKNSKLSVVSIIVAEYDAECGPR
jgi:hypothetical protein